jgi:leader peptidase (prepilin peptidase)/N-methyltransferase
MRVRTLEWSVQVRSVCATQLEARDLVPVVSYIVLRGRCRACQSRISPVALWVELGMGLVFMLHAFIATDVITLITGYVVISLCCVMALYDSRTHYLPNGYLFGLIAVGVIYRILVVTEIGIRHTGLGYVYMTIPALLLGLIVLYSRGKWMGAGDPLLLLGLSIVVGTWQGALFTLLFASWVGLIYVLISGVYALLKKKPVILHQPIAFGPCLVVGFVISWWLSLAGLLVFV